MLLIQKKSVTLGAALALSGLTVFALCDTPSTTPDSQPAAQKTASPLPLGGRIEKLDIPGTHNVFKVSPKLISGSQPEGDKAFKALAALGVKTLITVDGAKPDIEGARKYGMRYVQIPFSYDGLPREQSVTLARAVRELPGLIYLHCHHGKHRSPTATACVLVANDGWSNEDAVAFLKRAGTGGNYTGLWNDVRNYKVPTTEEINKAPHDYPAVVPPAPLVQTMVKMDELTEQLKESQDAKWGVPPDHPAIDPPHQALILREAYTELMREKASERRLADYRNWLTEGETASAELETALRAKDNAKADAAYKKVMANCTSCHAVYRNVPQNGAAKQ